MSEVSVQKLSPQSVVSAVLRQLNQEQIEDATACFATDFRYKDHGIGLEFRDKERLTEFFRKTRELYPDYFLQADETFVSGEDVITLWTLQVTITEPLYPGLTRRIPISIAGASIVRADNGKIADWADYYDGLTSRRTALAAHFTEWIEY
jgi:limonene-1,2-epoxide hydrolase